MLKHYSLIAFRNLIRNKFYSIINITGLSFGIMAAILIIVFIKHEFSYDRFHLNSDRIYRLIIEQQFIDKNPLVTPISVPEFGPAFNNILPEVINFTRVSPFSPFGNVVQYNENVFSEKKIFYTDSSFFEIFTFPIINGRNSEILTKPYSIVITESIADKYFGSAEALDKILTVNDEVYTVTGIVKNPPSNSHFHFDFLISISTIDKGDALRKWGVFYTYLLVDEKTHINSLESKINSLSNSIYEEYYGSNISIKSLKTTLQPLLKIHLYSNYLYELQPNGNVVTIYGLSLLGVIVILIASFNYVNFVVSKLDYRIKEISLRKVIGASGQDLIKQFVGESILISFLSFMFSIGLAEAFMKPFSFIVNRELTFNIINNWDIIYLVLFISIIIGILSGLYPAILISKFQPTWFFAGKTLLGIRSSVWRRIFLIFQFCITIFFLITLIIIGKQMKYLERGNLGFEKENLLVLQNFSRLIRKNAEVFVQNLSRNPKILNTSYSLNIPSSERTPTQKLYLTESNEDDYILISEIRCSYDFLKTHEMKLVEGRDFSIERPIDKKQSIILNETAVKMLGLDSPIGDKLRISNMNDPIVIGVVEDFHYESFHHNVKPFFIHIISESNWVAWGGHFSIKIDAPDIDETLKFIKEEFKTIDPYSPFEYFFMEDALKKMYESENRTFKILSISTYFAIVISFLGLLSISSFLAERKNREIGIRKVFGASIVNIILIFFREILAWTIIACIISCPVAYYFTKFWLENFAYRIDITLSPFFLSTVLTLSIVISTVFIQTFKTANANPANVLKYE